MTMEKTKLLQLFEKLLLISGFFRLSETKMFLTYRYILHTYFVFIFLNHCLEFVSHTEDIEAFALVLGTCLCMFKAIILICITRSAKYHSLIEEIFKYEEYMNKEAPGSLKKEYVKIAKRQKPIIMYTLLIPLNLLTSNILAAFFIMRYGHNNDNNRPIMVKVWVPFLDPEEHYIVANLYYSCLATVSTIIIVTLDCMILYPIVYFIFRINMLKFVLQNPEEFMKEKRMQTKDDKLYEILVKCISEHQNIIQEFGGFNNTMKHYFFFDFSLHALQISGVIFFTTKNMMNINNFLNFGYALSLLIQLFILYWYGQNLLDESESISNTIYLSDWYSRHIKSQRLMLSIMQRSQKPLGLIIGPIGIIQLEIMLKILKTVYTIFTIYSNI